MSVHLVRLQPPAKGDTIHLSDCRYALAGDPIRWEWADGRPWSEWSSVPWLKYCKVCNPIGELKPMEIQPEQVFPL
jgi:hypothetical protein